MNEERKTIALSDIYLSAFLRARGIPLVNTERRGGVVIFNFEQSEEAENLMRGFLIGSEVVVARAYRDALRDFRAMLAGYLPVTRANGDSQKVGEHAPVNRG